MGSIASRDASFDISMQKKKTRRAAQPAPAPTHTAVVAEPSVVPVPSVVPAVAAMMAGGLAASRDTPSSTSLLPTGSEHSVFGPMPSNQLGLSLAKASAPSHSDQGSTASEVRLALFFSIKLCSVQDTSSAAPLLCSFLQVNARCAMRCTCAVPRFQCCAVLQICQVTVIN